MLTPVAKFWICKRGSHFGQEAMECLGGNGYVEEQGEGVMARIYREMPLNSIWEGAGNIMALDLLRALRAPEMAGALEHEVAPARHAHAVLDRSLAATLRAIDGLTEEAQARRLARDLALLLQAALLRSGRSEKQVEIGITAGRTRTGVAVSRGRPAPGASRHRDKWRWS
jgi:putative acyl-CoA dehydrogenase